MKSRVQQNNAMVTHMDERIGNILTTLTALGKYDNTIIVFMSNHGISFGEIGVAGKVCLCEPSVTVPFIIKAPNWAADIKYADRVYLQDVFPTLLNLLNIEKKSKSRESIYLAMFDGQRGIISKKLILFPISGDYKLYDLEKHLGKPITKDKKGSEKTTSNLLEGLVNWQKETRDAMGRSKTYYRLY